MRWRCLSLASAFVPKREPGYTCGASTLCGQGSTGTAADKAIWQKATSPYSRYNIRKRRFHRASYSNSSTPPTDSRRRRNMPSISTDIAIAACLMCGFVIVIRSSRFYSP